MTAQSQLSIITLICKHADQCQDRSYIFCSFQLLTPQRHQLFPAHFGSQSSQCHTQFLEMSIKARQRHEFTSINVLEKSALVLIIQTDQWLGRVHKLSKAQGHTLWTPAIICAVKYVIFIFLYYLPIIFYSVRQCLSCKMNYGTFRITLTSSSKSSFPTKCCFPSLYSDETRSQRRHFFSAKLINYTELISFYFWQEYNNKYFSFCYFRVTSLLKVFNSP